MRSVGDPAAGPNGKMGGMIGDTPGGGRASGAASSIGAVLTKGACAMSDPSVDPSRDAERRAPGVGRVEGIDHVADLVAERLRLAFGATAAVAEAAPSSSSSQRIAEAAVASDAAALSRALAAEGLGAGTRSLDFAAVCRDIFTPAAERLGALWAEDRLSFAAVSIAMNRLCAAARGVADRAERASPERNDRRRILLATAPGESHDFGLVLVASACRLDGWDVALRLGARPDDLAALARSEPFDLVGLSVASELAAREMRELISSLRTAARASRSLDGGPLGVIVGGGALRARAGLGVELGADAAAAAEVASAPAQLNGLLDVMRAVR